MRIPLLALILLSLATPAVAQASPGKSPFLGATPVQPGDGDTLARDGIRSAKLALEAHQGLTAALRRATTPQARAQLEAAIAWQPESALRALLKQLGPMYRSSSATRMRIHQLATEALDDREGSAASRLAAQLEALRQIAALRP